MIMEPEKSQDLQSASWKLRRPMYIYISGHGSASLIEA